MHRSATIAVIAGAALGVACDRPAGKDSAADVQEERPVMEIAMPPAENPSPSSAGELRVTEITRNPYAHANQTITVVGEVEDMLGARAFKLNDDEKTIAGQDDDLVVLGSARANWKMDDSKGDARLRVKGKVERVPTPDLEQQLGWDLSVKLRSELANEKVVILADSIERIEGEPQRAQPGDTRQGAEREDVRGEEQQPATP